jgi:uncharacterized protein (DUF1015 family)
VPRFEPFPGLRYDPDRVHLAEVVAPPYDVVSPEERAELQSHSPYNSVRIEIPDEDPALDRYEAAARRIAQWQAEGILRRDSTPSLYGYRMTYPDEVGHRRHTIGVIGALGLEPPGTAGIFPHEQTTPKAKSDRLQLLQATRVNTSPIWALSLAAGLSDDLQPPASSEPVSDSDGTEHELWLIDDPATVARITEEVSAAPVVIADGHHRFQTALNYQKERRAVTGETSGSYDAVLALVVELAEEQLSVRAIHRLIGGLPPAFDVAREMSRHFALTPTDASGAALLEEMAGTKSLALVTSAGSWLLHPRAETIAAASQDLDSSRLEVALADLPDHEIVYEHRLDQATDAVATGDAQAAVLLRPVTVEQIASTGRGGELMPPKTTFFWPKPRTGFVFREVPD